MAAASLLLCAGHCEASMPPSPRSALCVHAHAPRSAVPLMQAAGGEEERREKLRQLFGDQTAERIVPETAREKALSQAMSMKMLQDGVQTLAWGATRLVDVDMAAGPLECALAPRLDGSSLLCLRLEMPLGMLIEEVEEDFGPAVVVEELLDEGSARPGGVRKGDLLRACTACTMAMSYPAWQLMLGGVGRPTMQKVLFPTDGEPFGKVLAAIGSNSYEQRGNGQIVLLLERRSNELEEAA
mmetsp:Transcript_23762/g.58978  ORF Transcript_23762/g.58978 Transcript_23762/m.58978 type:complete len:241 (+) Transcript_23762:13-735(+)